MRERRELKVYLRGGLGNQLFQYSAGVALAKRLGSSLILETALLNTHGYPGNKNGPAPRREEISSFLHSGKLAPTRFVNHHVHKSFVRLKQLERHLGDLCGPPLLGLFSILASESRDLREHFNAVAKANSINSYCSHPNFFANVVEQIQAEVTNVRQPSNFYLEASAELRHQSTIGIHIRLGDYKSLKHIYGELRVEYFKRALDLAKEVSGDGPVWVFSDEPIKARQILNEIVPSAKYIAPPMESRPIESLLLLSQMNSRVLSNSTFSWWSAWIAKSGPGLSIFPRPLHEKLSAPEAPGYLLPNWIQIGR